jgi:hypothetical protein
MLLAACFGSVGKMQTMDTICNHGGNYVDVLLRQFVVGGHIAVNTGLRWVFKEYETRLVPSDDLANYINEGWRAGFGLRWMHKGDQYRRITLKLVPAFEQDGWTLGLPCGYAHVLKDGVERHIPKTQLADYQKQGWTLGTLSGNQQPLSGVFLIYKLTSPEGKIYIGLTKDLTRRLGEHRTEHHKWSCQHNNVLHEDLITYGFDNFTQEVLADKLTGAEAEEQEAAWIALFESDNPDKGYNQASGGRLGTTYNTLACQANRERQLNRIKPQRGGVLNES